MLTKDEELIRARITILTDDIDKFDEAVEKCNIRDIVHFAREVGRSDSVLSKNDTRYVDATGIAVLEGISGLRDRVEVAVIRNKLGNVYYEIGDSITEKCKCGLK